MLRRSWLIFEGDRVVSRVGPVPKEHALVVMKQLERDLEITNLRLEAAWRAK